MRFDPARDEPSIAGRDSVANDLRRARSRETVRAGVVRAEHDRPRAAHELRERPFDVGEVGVDVEVIGLDVRDDGDRRRRERGTTGRTRPPRRRTVARRPRRRFPPHDATRPPTSAGRLATRGRERVRRHHRRRRLAVRAGDADQFPLGGDLAECLGPANHRDAQLARAHRARGASWASRTSRRARAPLRRARDRAAATRTPRRARSTAPSGFASHPVTFSASPDEQLGERAHTGSGDPDEVNRTRIVGIDERHVVVGRI